MYQMHCNQIWIVFIILTSLLINDKLLYSLVICSSCVMISSTQVLFDHGSWGSAFPTALLSRAVTAFINAFVVDVCVLYLMRGGYDMWEKWRVGSLRIQLFSYNDGLFVLSCPMLEFFWEATIIFVLNYDLWKNECIIWNALLILNLAFNSCFCHLSFYHY